MFGLLSSLSLRTVELVTQHFQANKHPPLATSPHPLGPSASSPKFSTDQNRSNVLYNRFEFYWWHCLDNIVPVEKWRARWKWQKAHIFYLLFSAPNLAFEVILGYPHFLTFCRTQRISTGLKSFFRNALWKRMWTLHIIGGNKEKPFPTMMTAPKRSGLFAAMWGCYMWRGNQ
jgi:hypothetical protein